MLNPLYSRIFFYLAQLLYKHLIYIILRLFFLHILSLGFNSRSPWFSFWKCCDTAVKLFTGGHRGKFHVWGTAQLLWSRACGPTGKVSRSSGHRVEARHEGGRRKRGCGVGVAVGSQNRIWSPVPRGSDSSSHHIFVKLYSFFHCKSEPLQIIERLSTILDLKPKE